MIICFHEIGTQKDNEYCLDPKAFRNILEQHPDAEIHFDDGRQGVMNFAAPILMSMGRTATIFIVPNFVGGARVPGHEKYSEFLTYDQIKALINLGFEIGSHTTTHRNLTMLSPSERINELKESKLWLEKQFSVEITKLSIPYGIIDHQTAREAQIYYKKIYTLGNPLGIKRTMVLNKQNTKKEPCSSKRKQFQSTPDLR